MSYTMIYSPRKFLEFEQSKEDLDTQAVFTASFERRDSSETISDEFKNDFYLALQPIFFKTLKRVSSYFNEDYNRRHIEEITGMKDIETKVITLKRNVWSLLKIKNVSLMQLPEEIQYQKYDTKDTKVAITIDQ